VNPKRYIGRQAYNEEVLIPHSLGPMNLTCHYCEAFYFKTEECKEDKVFTKKKCCMRGEYVFEFNFKVPDLIKNLLRNTHPESKNFWDNIRQFNSALAFASFAASVLIGNIQNVLGRGPYCFKAQGVIQHLSGHLRESDPKKLKYSQLYFVESSLANQCRQNRNKDCLESLLNNLDKLRHNKSVCKNFFYTQ